MGFLACRLRSHERRAPGDLRALRATVFLWVFLALASTAPALLADGKFYVRSDLPRMGEPFQRALVLHDAGKEFLLIQPAVVGDAREFGWVVPAPSVPAVGTLDAGAVHSIFFDLSRQSSPLVRRWGGLIWGVILTVLGLGSIAALYRGRKALGFGTFVVFLVAAFLFAASWPVLMDMQGGTDGVEVLGSARVGIWDVSVVGSAEPEALRAWFEEHGFAFAAEDEEIFRSYIERGWSFVTAHVAKDAEAEAEMFDRLLQPLALLFDSPEPVYPYALTATVEHPVEVLLYVAAQQRLECSPLATEYADEGWSAGSGTYGGRNPGVPFEEVPGAFVTWSLGAEAKPEAIRFSAPWLTKLRGTIRPGEVTGDLVLVPGAQEPYRKTVWRW